MKKLALFTAMVSALALSACASNSTATGSTTTSKAPAPAAQTVTTHTYDCDNGLALNVSYLGTDKVQVSMQGYTGELAIAQSASGSRYVSNTGLFGYGGEWHQKGNMGILAAKNIHGTPIQTVCQKAM